MYKIQTFSNEDESLTVAINEAERQALEFLAEHEEIELVSISTAFNKLDVTTFLYLLTIAYKV